MANNIKKAAAEIKEQGKKLGNSLKKAAEKLGKKIVAAAKKFANKIKDIVSSFEPLLLCQPRGSSRSRNLLFHFCLAGGKVRVGIRVLYVESPLCLGATYFVRFVLFTKGLPQV